MRQRQIALLAAYLETRLPAEPEWLEDPQPAFDAAQALWRQAQQVGATWNEAQTEDEFVKPLLAVLGWSYLPQTKNNRSGRINRPGYALFDLSAAEITTVEESTKYRYGEV